MRWYPDGDAGFDRRKTGGIGLTFDIEGVDVCDASLSSTQRHMIVAHNRNLIEYFARLALASDDNDNINLEYVETVLQNGADIDCTDKFGQSIFHEVSLESTMAYFSFYSETLNQRYRKIGCGY